MGEKTLQNKVTNLLNEKDIYYVKVWGGGYQSAGIPDLLICYKGVFIGCELKVNAKITAQQLEHLYKIKESGGIALITRELSALKEVINKISKGETNESIQRSLRLPKRCNQNIGRKISGGIVSRYGVR